MKVKRRKVYQGTELGREELGLEAKRLRYLVQIAENHEGNRYLEKTPGRPG